MDQFGSKVPSSFDNEVNCFVVNSRRNRERMPLISTEFRNVNEHVLTRLDHNASWLEQFHVDV